MRIVSNVNFGESVTRLLRLFNLQFNDMYLLLTDPLYECLFKLKIHQRTALDCTFMLGWQNLEIFAVLLAERAMHYVKLSKTVLWLKAALRVVCTYICGIFVIGECNTGMMLHKVDLFCITKSKIVICKLLSLKKWARFNLLITFMSLHMHVALSVPYFWSSTRKKTKTD